MHLIQCLVGFFTLRRTSCGPLRNTTVSLRVSGTSSTEEISEQAEQLTRFCRSVPALHHSWKPQIEEEDNSFRLILETFYKRCIVLNDIQTVSFCLYWNQEIHTSAKLDNRNRNIPTSIQRVNYSRAAHLGGCTSWQLAETTSGRG